MKFKSIITSTLALGVLATTGATFINNEASASKQQSHSTYHKSHAKSQVQYTITLNGITSNILSYLALPKNTNVSYKDLTYKVKSVLKYDRGVSDIDVSNAKKASYTVFYKNGTKKVVDLKSDIFSGNLFRARDIKKIDINVDVKIASKDKAKVTTQVPYTIAVNGTSAPILSSIAFPNKELISNKDLNAKVKSVLKHDRGIRDLDIQFAKQAKYTVHFKNGTKRVIDLKSNVITGNLFKASDIKNIEINVKQHNH
ncbi:MAP domain-containing protein [Staphylococcus argenteus]|uniref:MAP domain-containing protein n=1 Tax=Staphylococcus argenteus TaxID=985002 RepID=UPI00136D5F49|nr:MAP domain-containing protein [Staphylococcus argenteus]MBE2157444.1 MAP domain-containing protein [Staphylococcus argenteus]MDR7620162.1 MAP domain-containing protein [Staphylococcus argenteus]